MSFFLVWSRHLMKENNKQSLRPYEKVVRFSVHHC